MRMAEIASRLCVRHEVSLLIGGQEPAFSRLPPTVRRIALPVVVPRVRKVLDYLEQEERVDSYAAEDGGDALPMLRRRRQIIEEHVRRERPDVFVIEYFPLGRTVFGVELLPAIERVRAGGGRVLCSVRDILQGDIKARLAAPEPPDRRDRRIRLHERMLSVLNGVFDHLLIHGDPDFLPLDATVPGSFLDRIRIPVTYTGYVSERLPRPEDCGSQIAAATERGGLVVTSVGAGGSSGKGFLSHGAGVIAPAVEAWRRVEAAGRSGGRTMVIFGGVHAADEEIEGLVSGCGDGSVVVRRAAQDFLCWLQAADLSISRAGYNTCTNILATGVPAILLPSRSLSDQHARARVFAQKSIAQFLPDEELTPERLAVMIERGLDAVPTTHGVSLDGADATAAIIESLS
jgi:predicted glycosyltransferase